MLQRRISRHAATASLAILVAYVALAYVVAPEFWKFRDADRVQPLSTMVTTTPQGIPGDPINVGLVGERNECDPCFHRRRLAPRRRDHPDAAASKSAKA